ncbi:MAG: hypothetical protein J6Z14_08655 [Prevotella sp.]|nr:hypothetical protein [Prevotella sp.]
MERGTNIDFRDKSLYDIDPQLPMPDRDLTPEELEELIVNDIHSIYQLKDAV